MSNRGIVILATSHPYYGRVAHNLAVSIKATGSTIPICVMHNGRGLSHLNEQQKIVFDEIIEIKQQAFTAKLWLQKNTPFEETLYIDADTAWLAKRQPEELFDAMQNARFQIIVEGYYDPTTGEDKLMKRYNIWADLDQLKQKYELKGRLYQFRSEVIYFRKSDASVKKLFDLAIKIQEKPKLSVNLFGGYVPDEFALNVAASVLDFRPDTEDWKPSYWFNITKKMVPMPILAQQFYVLSVGGNFVSPSIKKSYNTVMAAAFHKMRLQYLFTLQSKRDSIPERNLM